MSPRLGGTRPSRRPPRGRGWDIIRLRLQSQSGLTLPELMIVLAIMGTLAAMAVPVIGDVLENARVVRAIADIKIIESEIAVFELKNGRLPTDLAEMGRGATRDAWGHAYEYLNFAAATNRDRVRKDHNLHPLNSTYDLYSKGRDGASQAALTAQASRDDIIRANDGGYVGLASNY